MDNDSTISGGAAGGASPAAGDPGPEETAISHDWARRRLDLYARLEDAIREGVAGALQTATAIREDVERDAAAYLDRLAAERARVGDEVADLERQRQAAETDLLTRREEIETALTALRLEGEAEVERERQQAAAETARLREEAAGEAARLRGEAAEEVAALRSTTRTEIDQMVQEAETRRAQVAAEVRALEEQVAQIQGVIDSFLDNQLQTLRGSLGGARPRPATARGADEDALGEDAVADVEAGGPAFEAGGSGFEVPGAGEASGPGAGPGGFAGAGGADGAGRTSVVITGVPHFSRARALWQAIQEVQGVAEARAVNYQGGVLALEVQHDPALDLSSSVTELPGLRLRVAEMLPGELRLTAET